MRHGRKNIDKPTKAEHRKRVRDVYNLLRSRASKRQIVFYMKEQYGVVTRTADRYIARAREQLTAETERPKKEHVVDAYSFYSNIVGDLKQPIEVRMKAQASIDKLLGLSMPIKVANTDAAGNDVSPESVRTELAALISEYEQLKRSGAAEAGAAPDAAVGG